MPKPPWAGANCLRWIQTISLSVIELCLNYCLKSIIPCGYSYTLITSWFHWETKLFYLVRMIIPTLCLYCTPTVYIPPRKMCKEDFNQTNLLHSHSTTLYLANKLSNVVMDLNSRLFPLGSLKNMVHCSPGWPSKRRCGSMMNFTPAARTRPARSWNCSCASPIRREWSKLDCGRSSLMQFLLHYGKVLTSVSANPKCGTGTSSPSTGLE